MYVSLCTYFSTYEYAIIYFLSICAVVCVCVCVHLVIPLNLFPIKKFYILLFYRFVANIPLMQFD